MIVNEIFLFLLKWELEFEWKYLDLSIIVDHIQFGESYPLME